MPIAKSGFCALLVVVASLLYTSVAAQCQIILVAGNEVVHRFRVGDTFRTKLADDRSEHWGFLVEINEFYVITSRDTIDLRAIEKVLLPGKTLAHKIGSTLVTVGVGLFAVDQVNYTLVQGNDLSIDSGIAKTSVALVATGLPLLFIKKKWAKPKGGLKLVSVSRDSRFYKPDL